MIEYPAEMTKLINDMYDSLLYTILIVCGSILLACIAKMIKDIAYEVLCRFLGYKVASRALDILTFTGTIHHELSHALLALVTGAKLQSITLFKLFSRDESLGSVCWIPRGSKLMKSIQHVLISYAPVMIGTFTLLLMYLGYDRVTAYGTLAKAVYSYIFISILLHTSMSRDDIKIALHGLPWLIILTFLIVFVAIRFCR